MRPALLALALALTACQQVARCEQDLLVANQRIRQVEEDKKKLEAQVVEEQNKIEALVTQLIGAGDEIMHLKLQNQLEVERAKTDVHMKAPPTKCNCVAGDPLCTCR